MKYLSYVFIFMTSLFHFLFFKLESVDFMKPEVYQRFNLNEASAVFAKDWAFNQGFYNLFFAIGLLYVLMFLYLNKGHRVAILANFILLSIVGAGLVLYFSTGKGLAAMLQTVPALLGLVFFNLWQRSNSATIS